MKRLFPALLLCLALSGCGTFRSVFEEPKTKLPPAYQSGNAGTMAIGETWWTVFGDEDLNRWVGEALARNNDLAIAAIRVRRAQLEAGLAVDDLTPDVSASLSSGTSRNLGESDRFRGDYSATANVRYEVDLWGRLAAARDAARWEARATEQDRLSARQSLITTVLGLYWQTAYLNQRIAYSRQSLESVARTLALVTAQHAAGAVSGLDLAEAQQSLEAQRSTQLGLQQQLVETQNALGLLYDGQMPDLPQPTQLGQTPLPEIAAGLPAELLARRPDLRAVELRLRRVLASRDAVAASYYPALDLTGSLGASSGALFSVLQNPVAALGVGLTLPFLEYNRMRLDTEVSETEYQEAVVNFRQTLYVALADVNNALSARQTLAAQEATLTATRTAAATATRIYQAQYREGAADLRSQLDAEERLRSADISLLDNRLNQLNNQATLYAALGGGSP